MVRVYNCSVAMMFTLSSVFNVMATSFLHHLLGKPGSMLEVQLLPFNLSQSQWGSGYLFGEVSRAQFSLVLGMLTIDSKIRVNTKWLG